MKIRKAKIQSHDPKSDTISVLFRKFPFVNFSDPSDELKLRLRSNDEREIWITRCCDSSISCWRVNLIVYRSSKNERNNLTDQLIVQICVIWRSVISKYFFDDAVWLEVRIDMSYQYFTKKKIIIDIWYCNETRLETSWSSLLDGRHDRYVVHSQWSKLQKYIRCIRVTLREQCRRRTLEIYLYLYFESQSISCQDSISQKSYLSNYDLSWKRFQCDSKTDRLQI